MLLQIELREVLVEGEERDEADQVCLIALLQRPLQRCHAVFYNSELTPQACGDIALDSVKHRTGTGWQDLREVDLVR